MAQTIASNSVSYQHAHQALNAILQGKLFHTPKAPTPWWMRALQWLAKHLHIDLGAHALRDVGFALVGVCILLLLTAVVIVWRMIHQRAKGRAIHVSFEQTDTRSLLESAESAYVSGDYHQMLHFLIEAQLVRASSEGWVRLRPSKTLRTYRRELSRLAISGRAGSLQTPGSSRISEASQTAQALRAAKGPQVHETAHRVQSELSGSTVLSETAEDFRMLFVESFAASATLAESVWFGKRPLQADEAKRVLDEVSDALLPKGGEAS